MGLADAVCKGVQQKKADRCRFHLFDVQTASLLVAVVLPVCEAAGRCCAGRACALLLFSPGIRSDSD
jgi:hypothetical protein